MGYLHWLLAALQSSANTAYTRLHRSNFSAYGDVQTSAFSRHWIHYEEKKKIHDSNILVWTCYSNPHNEFPMTNLQVEGMKPSTTPPLWGQMASELLAIKYLM